MGHPKACCLALALNVAGAFANPIKPRGLISKSAPIDLVSHFNNKAFGTYAGEAAFDPLNQSYPAPAIAHDGSYTSTQSGIQYGFPGYTGPNKSDNVLCTGQTIEVPKKSYFSASLLVASDVELETVSGNLTFTYRDDTTSVSELRSEPWWAFLTINRGEIIFPYRYTANGTNFNTTHIYEYSYALDNTKSLASITLPTTTNTTTGRLHVFAISLWEGSGVSVQSVRPTQKWVGNGTQVVEVTINNAGTQCVSGAGLKVTLSGGNITTVSPGYVKRLCLGDQKRVNIGTRGTSKGSVSVTLDDGSLQQNQTFNNLDLGLSTWTSELDNLAQHEAPDWFDGAKFGIFIHWGPYAVPGWGNSTPHESYAEWFWWYTTHHPEADASDFYDYRLRTFGPDWNYDDSFVNYTASKFDPRAWVDLFAHAGAKYFVFTTKHHDGFANFDTGATSNRSSIHYGPKRDILGELFDAAAEYQPSLRRGTYFSLPEWFNPDFGPYGFSQLATNSSTTWPGMLATNPYTGLAEPYTGHIPVDDFITDVMVPQMEILAYNYSTDIMWCDCGAANGTADFAASWWNTARSQNRQVTMNSRCGLAHTADFDTPEYTTFSTAQARKWESNQGMDPYSYGYNRATNASAYMNASTIIKDLVDMVSKNGNFLLDVGPKADGSFVQEEVDNLKEAGKWINSHGEAIFNTTYWFVMPEDRSGRLRFTQTEGAFYVFSFEKPKDGLLVVDAVLPILPGDDVTAVGVGNASAALKWEKSDEGTLKIEVPQSISDSEKYCWVYKIEYFT
ncbi:glycoside hydrolase family 29 protein [Aureobasidium subglaciale EXF-2481]|uniref:alpha-L-fucosidase n=1 Tax=Aureobasidium subglaciale (strain EXF-2481) TaxID=1043005 RepID=A0A074YFS1_AURSE|nr:glycoside hydrolase family 29 protein [Aureobasidium subglaciale EXF-2481]KAI5201057.1 putative alpha-L-fucosidase [Aureobasidium subglaciale]KAI5219714.1 putative alpha-L-fucosidase [Aureobasidium subglaciale]KAI5223475.1 putative alpha-L-fucosidase [Aureobasidium subglaciale]KAI5260419.1 putative alpha-L-fucosidase [Aureobasidium subglaciale]KEQ96643.1 glycoside hydrolase family 29 protein [Aureobasidium subglaciale EXF-2481]